jgi:hypothetical protein
MLKKLYALQTFKNITRNTKGTLIGVLILQKNVSLIFKTDLL